MGRAGTGPGATQRISHYVRLQWPKITFFRQILVTENHGSIVNPAELYCQYQAAIEAAQMALHDVAHPEGSSYGSRVLLIVFVTKDRGVSDHPKS
jgi:hypothetical protein